MSQPRETGACPFAQGAVGSVENPAELDPGDPDFLATAFELYAELRERGPVARARFRLPPEAADPPEDDDDATRSPFFVEHCWLVTRYDEAVAVLQDDARFSVDPTTAMSEEEKARLPPRGAEDDLFARNLLTMDAPDHTRLRRLVQPWFAGPPLEALRPRIRRIAERLLDEAERAAAGRGEVAPDRAMELVDAFAYPLPVTVISDMLGVPEADRPRVRAWTEELLTRRSRDPRRVPREEQRRFVRYLRDLAALKRREPAEDLVSFLVHAEDDEGRLDEDELLSLVFLLFVAGHVTTVNLIGSAVVALLRWPDQMALVRADRGRVKLLVEETLRYWGPAENTIPRVAREATEIGGVRVAAGERVSVSLASADRDPRRFDDPERFDLGRADARRHFAFGRGAHTCLGAPLARMEAAIAIDALLERCPDLRLAVPPSALRWKEMFLRGWEAVPVRF